MLFNSVDFIVFFPIVVLGYFIVPRRARHVLLLVASYYFYMSWNPRYAVLIGLSTAITYVCAFLIHGAGADEKAKKLWLALNCAANLGILFVFKYANFFIENISAVMARYGLGVIRRRLDVLLPVGISFYTFQALSYTFDVYRGKLEPEKNFLKYALYVSFFPQLVAGPIERSVNLLPQIQRVDKLELWDFARIRDGFLLMIWGYFQKLVIADRAALLVNNVVNNYARYGLAEIALAMILFAFQIYCDFGGYTNIARGAARVMGFELMANFRQPYLAWSIKEFWRRWHISLTSWFTDYLYIPLGGNRKGELRKYVNIFIVFGVSGLWHGADWSFVVWGLLHAVFQVAGEIKNRVLPRENVLTADMPLLRRVRKILGTFILTDLAWVFFVSPSLADAAGMLRQAFAVFRTGSPFSLGLDRGNMLVLLAALLVLLAVDIAHERGVSVFRFVNEKPLWFRWPLYYALLWITLMFGIYGPAYDTGAFIYFQF